MMFDSTGMTFEMRRSSAFLLSGSWRLSLKERTAEIMKYTEIASVMTKKMLPKSGHAIAAQME